MGNAPPGTRHFASNKMILTPQKVPKTLKHVHLIVRVAGRVFENKLEPDPLLEHTFAWDKTNIYNQKVYGIVDAEVSVGYEYTDCPGKDSNTMSCEYSAILFQIFHMLPITPTLHIM